MVILVQRSNAHAGQSEPFISLILVVRWSLPSSQFRYNVFRSALSRFSGISVSRLIGPSLLVRALTPAPVASVHFLNLFWKCLFVAIFAPHFPLVFVAPFIRSCAETVLFCFCFIVVACVCVFCFLDACFFCSELLSICCIRFRCVREGYRMCAPLS